VNLTPATSSSSCALAVSATVFASVAPAAGSRSATVGGVESHDVVVAWRYAYAETFPAGSKAATPTWCCTPQERPVTVFVVAVVVPAATPSAIRR
jgi:hypothetical protein